MNHPIHVTTGGGQLCISRSLLIDRNGGKVVHISDDYAKRNGWNDGPFVLSVQQDGSVETRPDGSAGAWETGQIVGDKWIVTDSAYPTGAYAFLLVG